jgi:hypothetical protein
MLASSKQKSPAAKTGHGTHVFDDLRGLEREAPPVKRKAANIRLMAPRLLAAAGIDMIMRSDRGQRNLRLCIWRHS